MDKKTFFDFQEFTALSNRANNLIARFQQYCDFYLKSNQRQALSEFIASFDLVLKEFIDDYADGLSDKSTDKSTDDR